MTSPASPTATPRTNHHITIVVLLVVLVLAVLLIGAHTLDLVGAAPGYGRPFHDALGLFSATVPNDWKVVGGVDKNYHFCQGDNTVSACFTTEIYAFQDQQQGDTSAEVSFLVEPITTPAQKVVMCHAFPSSGANSTFDGEPAEVSGIASIVFNSGNAHFQITTEVPTSPTYKDVVDGPPYTPTVTNPAPANLQVLGIISTIQVTDHSSC